MTGRNSVSIHDGVTETGLLSGLNQVQKRKRKKKIGNICETKASDVRSQEVAIVLPGKRSRNDGLETSHRCCREGVMTNPSCPETGTLKVGKVSVWVSPE